MVESRIRVVGIGELLVDLGLHNPKPDEEPAATTPQAWAIAEEFRLNTIQRETRQIIHKGPCHIYL